jgi:DNA-binding response OmpR family regulator/chromosome segregation ATPase
MAIKVLVFESDPTFAETLRSGLLKYGCEVSVVDDANNGLQAASRDRPDLILLAIELPRMNGFSVCNKLKRDPALKDVPLLIMSSESTEETFEQHRRLRTRAEDYVKKPIAFEELVAHIQPFVSLVPAATTPNEGSPLNEEAVVIEDDLEIEEAEVVESVAVETANADAELGARDGTVDADVDHFAEQAFGALIDEPEITAPSLSPEAAADLAAPSSEHASELESDEISMDEADISLDDAEVSTEVVVSEPSPAGAPPSTTGDEAVDIDDTDEVELDDLEDAAPAVDDVAPLPVPPSALPPPPPPAKLASLRPASLPPRAAEVGDVGKYREELEKSRSRVKDLEDEVRRAKDRVDELEEVSKRGAGKDMEVQRLQRDLDDAKAKLASSGKGAGSAREFLDLREQLNKKDKEILDYKDQLSHKEKELLALRDGVIALEREKADLSDRIAELERQVSDLARVADAAKSDKDQAVKRADDFKRKAEKTKADLDSRIAELGQLGAAHQAALAEKDEQYATLVADHQQAQQEAERAKTQAIAAAEAAAREAAHREHAQALNSLRAEHAATTAAAVAAREAEIKSEHDSKLAALHRANEDALGKLRAEHQQALAEQQLQAEKVLAEREAEIIAEHEQEQAKESADHSVALLARDAQKQASEAARDARIAALEADVAARAAERDDAHRTLEQLSERNALLSSELAQRTNERDSAALTLEQRETRVTQLEAELSERTAQRDQEQRAVEERDNKIVQLEAAMAAATAESNELRSTLRNIDARLSRASGKWHEDRASLERAKDALAAALLQIEEAESRPFE